MNQKAFDCKAEPRPSDSVHQQSHVKYEARKQYVLAELRCAVQRTKLAAADIAAIGLALKTNVITPDQVYDLLDASDCLGFLPQKGAQ
jgi:hypothetical protein